MVSQNQFVDKVLVTENNCQHNFVHNVGITYGPKNDVKIVSAWFDKLLFNLYNHSQYN